MSRRILKQLPVPDAYGDPWYERIRCNWDDCENPGSLLYKIVVCHGARRHASAQMCAYCETKTFCCHQHGDYWRRSHIPGQYGKLSAGTNRLWL